MLSIVFAVVLGLGFTFLATQNPLVVPVNLFGSSYSLPLYIIVAFAFLTGIAISLFFYLVDMAGSALDLAGRDNKINRLNSNVQKLEDHISKLTKENTELRAKLGMEKAEAREAKIEAGKEKIRSTFARIRHSTN